MVFLSLFGEKLNGTDPEESILNAFKLFDPNGTGTVNKNEFKQLLLTQADKKHSAHPHNRCLLEWGLGAFVHGYDICKNFTVTMCTN
ncbi:PREDICTED: myosin regulatory light chain 2, atrial isoform [Crocodylus porosus]|uniref:myosin regulatory light chain 2, atrial isoform n=1 Tax=Crocodylus porosus TaxID=8502 RepID=UPI00093C5869|nr:PREDICTED: myosin regulatory light chain 2, atrial isoform [Crocodylus porosus]